MRIRIAVVGLSSVMLRKGMGRDVSDGVYGLE
jgi:hypothetical protein